MSTPMLSVFYLSLFCGVLSLLFERQAPKRALGVFRAVCVLAALSVILFAPVGEAAGLDPGTDRAAEYLRLSEETAASVFAEAERALGQDLSARIAGELAVTPLVCTVKLDREKAVISGVTVIFDGQGLPVSGYRVKMLIADLYGKAVKTEVIWNGQGAS